MPNADTFGIEPIAQLLREWCKPGMVIVDPFARNSKVGTLRNDLNPETSAEFHMDATGFLQYLVDRGDRADVCLFDPPYSPRQVIEVYQAVGRKMGMEDAQGGTMFSTPIALMDKLLVPGGIAIRFGWNSIGFGKPYERLVTMLVCHGGAHNDTIVTVDRKSMQSEMFGGPTQSESGGMGKDNRRSTNGE